MISYQQLREELHECHGYKCNQTWVIAILSAHMYTSCTAFPSIWWGYTNTLRVITSFSILRYI